MQIFTILNEQYGQNSQAFKDNYSVDKKGSQVFPAYLLMKP